MVPSPLPSPPVHRPGQVAPTAYEAFLESLLPSASLLKSQGSAAHCLPSIPAGVYLVSLPLLSCSVPTVHTVASKGTSPIQLVPWLCVTGPSSSTFKNEPQPRALLTSYSYMLTLPRLERHVLAGARLLEITAHVMPASTSLLFPSLGPSARSTFLSSNANPSRKIQMR